MTQVYLMVTGSGKIGLMPMSNIVIRPVSASDLLTITRMTFENMSGVDQHFTRITRNPLRRLVEYAKMPVYLALAGPGHKVVHGREIVGCAFLHFRHVSAYVFNVSVNRAYRRQGIGRLLMKHLQQVARQKNLLWMALQVDDGNRPAQQLYQEMGYQTYHPHFMRLRNQNLLIKADASGLGLKSLSAQRGRQLYRRYHNTEVQTGDLWAVSILNDYETTNSSSGMFWRCILNDREVGCVWITMKDGRLQLRLAFQPDYWGHLTTGGLIKCFLDEQERSQSEIDVYFASSAHHRSAEPLLKDLGFETGTMERLMMFKNIVDSP